jgi:hypothetical protein
VSQGTIADQEVLYRRIRCGSTWFEPPDRLTSANFKLKKLPDGQFEEGLSVYRASIVSVAEVLAKPDALPGSMVASATAGEIRALRNAAGVPLNLSIVAVDDEDDPGHAEIRGPEPRRLSESASKRLKSLFKLVSSDSA